MIRYKMKPDEEITEETAEKRKHGENISQYSIVVFVEKMEKAEEILSLIESVFKKHGIECVLAKRGMTLFTRGISIVFKTPTSPGIGYGHSLYWVDTLPDKYRIKGTYEGEHYCNMKMHLQENCEELRGILDVLNVVLISDKLCGGVRR